MSITNCIKRLFNRKPEPDVLLIGNDGQLELSVSKIIARRRIVESHGRLLVLCDDGSVRGSYYFNTWEAL